MASVPTVSEVVAALDHRNQGDLADGERRLWTGSSFSDLVSTLIAAYPQIRSAPGRNTILFRLIRHARSHHEIVELAIAALNDRAYLPRMQALAILAYSQTPDVVQQIQPLLEHRDPKTRADAAAAIDAIRSQNHHYWFDRDHSNNF